MVWGRLLGNRNDKKQGSFPKNDFPSLWRPTFLFAKKNQKCFSNWRCETCVFVLFSKFTGKHFFSVKSEYNSVEIAEQGQFYKCDEIKDESHTIEEVETYSYRNLIVKSSGSVSLYLAPFVANKEGEKRPSGTSNADIRSETHEKWVAGWCTIGILKNKQLQPLDNSKRIIGSNYLQSSQGPRESSLISTRWTCYTKNI